MQWVSRCALPKHNAKNDLSKAKIVSEEKSLMYSSLKYKIHYIGVCHKLDSDLGKM